MMGERSLQDSNLRVLADSTSQAWRICRSPKTAYAECMIRTCVTLLSHRLATEHLWPLSQFRKWKRQDLNLWSPYGHTVLSGAGLTASLLFLWRWYELHTLSAYAQRILSPPGYRIPYISICTEKDSNLWNPYGYGILSPTRLTTSLSVRAVFSEAGIEWKF